MPKLRYVPLFPDLLMGTQMSLFDEILDRGRWEHLDRFVARFLIIRRQFRSDLKRPKQTCDRFSQPARVDPLLWTDLVDSSHQEAPFVLFDIPPEPRSFQVINLAHKHLRCICREPGPFLWTPLAHHTREFIDWRDCKTLDKDVLQNDGALHCRRSTRTSS